LSICLDICTDSIPCKNGGGCIDKDTKFTCDCNPGFGSYDCHTGKHLNKRMFKILIVELLSNIKKLKLGHSALDSKHMLYT